MSRSSSERGRTSIGTLLLIAAWFGIVTGLIEGPALLLFQRINWARWGAMIHVSAPIIWIAPLVDAAFFLLVACLVALLARFIRRFSPIRVVAGLLACLATYDWLSLTGRLKYSSCWLLAVGVGVAFSRWAGRNESTALRFWKRTLPWITATLALTLIGIQGQHWLTENAALRALPPPVPGAPNVLVIVVDTLRADHLSSYGYRRPTSPNIDRLAREGALFENAVSASSWSLPSHASMLTGRYQFEHGAGDVSGTPIVQSNSPGLAGYPTLGEALQQRGYRSAAFSANRTYFSQNLGFGRGFTHFEDYFHSVTDSVVRTQLGGALAGLYLNSIRNPIFARALRSLGCDALLDADLEGAGGIRGAAHVRKRATVVNDELLRWIDADRSPRPFFAFLNYFDVHNPYGAPVSYPKPAWPQGTAADQYDDSVKYVDDAIGELISELEKRSLTKNTLVVITSDHGESLGEHHLTYHGHALYWELVHVPLILWYPGHVPTGVRVSVPVSNAALPATVLNLLSGQTAPFTAEPLDALWRTPPSAPGVLLSELVEEHFLEAENQGAEKLVPLATQGAMKSLLAGQWHLIVHKKFGSQLYDWIHDPAEATDLFHTPEGQKVSARLLGQMGDLLAGSPAGHALSAAAVQNVTFKDPHRQRHVTQPATPVNDYYRLQAKSGSSLGVEVHAESAQSDNQLDPVVTILDSSGEPLAACRDLADDHIPAPGTADSTPEAFDDACVNDDASPGTQTDSRLEILVPGSGNSPVELYVRVSDWNGRVAPGMSYQLAVSQPGQR